MKRFIRELAYVHGISRSSEINIDTLLSNSNTSTLELLPEHLEGQTLESIRTAIHTSLLTVYTNKNIDLNAIHTKLADYRYVDELYQLQRGKHVRWIRIPRNTNVINIPENTTPPLTNGGIVVDIKIQDTGVHVLCKNGKRYIQYKFDDCLTYQKLSTDELLILTAIRYMPTSM
jgi:hypothetical protein